MLKNGGTQKWAVPSPNKNFIAQVIQHIFTVKGIEHLFKDVSVYDDIIYIERNNF